MECILKYVKSVPEFNRMKEEIMNNLDNMSKSSTSSNSINEDFHRDSPVGERDSLSDLYKNLGCALLERAEAVGLASPEGRRRSDEAVRAFQGALGELPDNPELTFLLARSYEAQGNYNDSIKKYSIAIQADPQITILALDHLVSLLNPSRVRVVAEAVANILNIDSAPLPDDAAAAVLTLQGFILRYQDNFEEAARRFKQALVKAPDTSQLRLPIYEGFGEALRRDDRPDGRTRRLEAAVDYFQSALQYSASDPKRRAINLLRLSLTLNDLGRYDEAISIAEEGLALDAGLGNELGLARARSLFERGDVAAVAEMQDLLSVDADPGLPAIIRAEAGALRAAIKYDQEAYEEAFVASDAALDLVATHPPALRVAGLVRLARPHLVIKEEKEKDSSPEATAASKNTSSPDETTEINHFPAAIRLLQQYARKRPDEAERLATTFLDKWESRYIIAAREIRCAGLEITNTAQYERAQAHYEAGKAYYDDNQYADANKHFKVSLELDAKNLKCYWYYADSLFREDQNNKNLVEEARRQWNIGLKKANFIPDPDDSWIYLTASWIVDQESRLNNRNKILSMMEGMAYLERRLIHYSNDVLTFATIAYFYRVLDLNANALLVTEKGMDINPNDVSLLDERAAICANIGIFDEAAEIIDRRRENVPYDWADSVRAFIHLCQGEYLQAINLLELVLDKNPTDIWSKKLYAANLRLSKQYERAYQVYSEIWERRLDRDYSVDPSSFGWSGYYLAIASQNPDQSKLEEVKKIFEGLIHAELTDVVDTSFALGLCHLALGNMESAKEWFLRGIESPGREPRLFSELRDFDLVDAQDKVIHWPSGHEGLLLLQRIVHAMDEVIANFRRPTPEEELLRLREEYHSDPHSWGWIAATAGLARLCVSEERWSEALDYYRLLEPEKERFPEASLGLTQALEELCSQLQKQGDELLREGNAHESVGYFQQALERTAEKPGSYPKEQADLHTRLACAYVDLGDSRSFKDQVIRALQGYADAESDKPGKILGDTLRPLIRSIEHYWAVISELQSVRSDVPAPLQIEIDAALEVLAGYLNEQYDFTFNPFDFIDSWRGNYSEKYFPVATPIILEVAELIVPKVDSRSDGGTFLDEMIPAMQGRIEQSTGVRVPGVRGRRYKDAPTLSSYKISLNEVAVAHGILLMDKHYCRADPALLHAAGIAIVQAMSDPRTGQAGAWIEPIYAEAAVTAGYAVLTDTDLLIAHLESLLRQNLAMFLSIQEVDSLISKKTRPQQQHRFYSPEPTNATSDGKENEASRDREVLQTLLANIAPEQDQEARICFARLLRALVRDGVPIVDWHTLLAALQGQGLTVANLDAAVRTSRSALKAYLPGNRPDTLRLPLPGSIEEAVARAINGNDSLVSAPQFSDWLDTISSLLSVLPSQAVLVVQRQELRPIVRRMIRAAFPELMVVAEEELLPLDAVETARPTE
jgi:tetratricopeptide (TPR) repeat protein